MRRVALQRLVETLTTSGTRHASGGRRDFFQRINEQHLAHELQNIANSAHSAQPPDPGLFDPKLPARRFTAATPAFQDGASGAAAPGLGGGGAGSGGERRRAKPWLHYESLRGETYPSGGKTPQWQDLTHSEAQRLQEMYMRKRMLDRKLQWLKMQHLPNPQREAKLTMRRQKQAEEEKVSESAGPAMYPPPFLDAQPGARKLVKMEEAARTEELESRFRARIREQKLENARIVKAAVPDVGTFIADPIKRHVHRRLVRQRVKIHTGLEGILTANSAQILFEFLKGVAISIVKVRAKRPRQTQEIFYSLTSDHDPAWVQKQLEVLAPKLRSQLALKVNMGQTPNIRFVPVAASQEIRRAHLWKYARDIKDQIPSGGGFGSNFGVG